MSKKKYDVVIACGGLGSRLKGITNDIPKPLFPINGKSTLERSIEQLDNFKFKNVIITIGYKSNQFQNHIKELNQKYKINVDSYIEETPLGECGALWHIKDNLCNDFVFINGDLIFSIDFKKLNLFHLKLSSKLTLVTHTSDHPDDSDLVTVPNGTLIENIFLKDPYRKIDKNAYLGNSGIFVINKELLEKLDPPKELESKSVFHFIVKKFFDLKINIFSYNTTEYIKDMGTPERLKIVENDLFNNRVFPKNYKYSQKALFLDRDNTLIKCPIGKYAIDKNEIQLINRNIDNIIPIASNYDLVCIVTNQPVVAMGKISLSDLDEINSIVVKFCLARGLKIDIVTICPHHPHKGFKGELEVLKYSCFCRKPNPGLFFEQAFLRNINLKESLMIGDSDNDLFAAKNAGCNFLNVNKL